jgi:hypothetical protein
MNYTCNTVTNTVTVTVFVAVEYKKGLYLQAKHTSENNVLVVQDRVNFLVRLVWAIAHVKLR